MNNSHEPTDDLPELPNEDDDVYRCRDLEWMGEFYVNLPGQPANRPVALGEACMWHDRSRNTVAIFDTWLQMVHVDWAKIRACADGKADVDETCRAVGASRRCMTEYWMSDAARPSIEYFSSHSTGDEARSLVELSQRVVARDRAMKKRYPQNRMGADNLVFDLGQLDYVMMYHHPPLQRGNGETETRLRPPSQYCLPANPGDKETYLGATLHYQHLAIGALMHAHKCDYDVAKDLWWFNSGNVLPSHDHVPTNDASNILMNYADIVLRAVNVPKKDPTLDIHSREALLAMRAQKERRAREREAKKQKK